MTRIRECFRIWIQQGYAETRGWKGMSEWGRLYVFVLISRISFGGGLINWFFGLLLTGWAVLFLITLRWSCLEPASLANSLAIPQRDKVVGAWLSGLAGGGITLLAILFLGMAALFGDWQVVGPLVGTGEYPVDFSFLVLMTAGALIAYDLLFPACLIRKKTAAAAFGLAGAAAVVLLVLAARGCMHTMEAEKTFYTYANGTHPLVTLTYFETPGGWGATAVGMAVAAALTILVLWQCVRRYGEASV